MDTKYNPKTIEDKWSQFWQKNNYFAPQGGKNNHDNYCIMIPPPNVTGTLHMGHAFSDTIMDTLIRYHRMMGHNTLWQAGMDHAGIATQMVVERQLNNTENKTKFDIGRDNFVKKVWDWKDESGGKISQQLKRLGSSLDWQNERFTMDEGMSAAVRKVFINLYDEGLIYRGKRLINWDPVLQTALSDLEVINTEEDGFMHNVLYPFVDGSGAMEIATTRPETILADGALAVNPDDKRFKNVVGKMVYVPLCNRKIPIITDNYVDPEFGTGCVKITPAHDFNDWEVGKRHEMEIINLFTADAKMNENAPKAYFGMDRFIARKQILKDLEHNNLLVKITPHKLTPPRGDRSGAILEPFLTDQWFVKIESLAQPAIKAVKTGEIKFVPDNWQKTYFNWMENITDWCISRQLWWGHRIPAWFDENGKIYVGENETDVRKKHNLNDNIKLKQDEDVLDTWFSSALWPFSTLGWPQKTDRLKSFYPTSVLVTGFDIIFFWVARMIMFGLKFMDDVPFKEIYIHGLIKDSHGQKMSKSKGNVLDPIDLIDGIKLDDLIQKRTSNMMQPHLLEKITKDTKKEYPQGIDAYGTDALRWTFASLASTGRDIIFDMKRIEGYRNFCNKLYNASRFVLLNCDDIKITKPDNILSPINIWINDKLQDTTKQSHKHIKNYRFDLLCNNLYEFTWNEYCDWYIEFSKVIIFDDKINPAIKTETIWTLLNVLEKLLRLLHPVIPFITEELWQQVNKITTEPKQENKTIMLQPYPTYSKLTDNKETTNIEWLKNIITAIRKIRADKNIKPSDNINIIFDNTKKEDDENIQKFKAYIKKIAKVKEINHSKNTEIPAEIATTIVNKIKIIIPLEGLLDKEQEAKKIKKQIENLKKEQEFLDKKLSNQNFTNKAPKNIVQKQQEKLDQIKKSIQQLNDNKNG
ncbi:MAG: valine--tRNA ligase [Gammaproteobacteria bacterium]|nr:MAG: valine--tRNA ligase [Gammaproteobacteria bacterium]